MHVKNRLSRSLLCSLHSQHSQSIILLLRSASNYLLGLTPVQLGPLVVGTVAGMSVWSVLYASLGGASKVLLESGTDLDVLMAGEGSTAVSQHMSA